MDDIVKRLIGQEGTTVRLMVRSDGGRSRQVVATRHKVELTGVRSHMLDNGVGLIDIDYFTPHTPRSVADAVDDLAGQGMKSLVLDLRGNTGGVYSGIVATADLFVPAQRIMFMEKPLDGKSSPVRSQKPTATEVPIVVLVDNKTGGAELVAAALLRTNRGTVVGPQTAGSSQNKHQIKRPDGSSDLIGQSEFLLYHNKRITGEGVRPNVILPDSATPDEVVHKGIELARQAAERGVSRR